MSQSPDRPAATRITCDPCLDISGARALHTQLQEALQTAEPVVLQADQVERVDTAALQVLSAFMREAQERRIAVQWLHPSVPLQYAAQLLDLTAIMALPAMTD